MVLPGQKIRELRIISPFSERLQHLNGMSYGLGPASYDIRVAEDMTIWQNTVLASTVEYFDMPDDVLGVVHDKSTWARLGLTVQNTVIDPGFAGFITLELVSHSRLGIKLTAGMPIAQVVFHRLEAPAEKPYEGKYQNQAAGPQLAILKGK